MLTTTLTGQLSLLMLIEGLEASGIEVISANTDGVTMKCPAAKRTVANQVIEAWEKHTGFKTEETEYSLLCSRDVNNYFAIKKDGKIKAKGAYFDPWRDDESIYERLKNSPKFSIVIEAAIAFVTQGTPIAVTVRSCRDIRKFVGLKNVNGGGVLKGEYLGKVVRWYYGAGRTDPIVYAKTGNMVAESTGAVACMTLPVNLPEDLDYAKYEEEAHKVLAEIAFTSPAVLTAAPC